MTTSPTTTWPRRAALRRTLASALALAGLCAPYLALAQTTTSAPAVVWPTKTVRMMVPAGAGTAPDIMARLVGERLSKMWGQSVVIENKVGAGGVVGMAAVKTAERDNHQLVFAPASVYAMTPYMFRSTQVDIVKEFTGIAMVGLSPRMMAVSATSSANSLADVLAQARKEGTAFVVATPFAYSLPHLTSDLLSKAAGVPMRVVPFTTSAQAISAVVNGDAHVMVDGIPPIDPMVKGGRMKAIASFSEARLPGRSQLATVVESYPSMIVNGWFGISAPAGMPQAVIDKINRDVNSVTTMPEVVERFDTLGVYPAAKPMSPAQFNTFWDQERQRWEKALKDVGAQPVQQ
jgi:tripartite-type tricarboxylate transporter receptor subunit TctC